MFRGPEGSECDAVWTCILLDVYWRLGEGEARMSALQERLSGAAHSAVEVVMGRITRLRDVPGEL